MRWLFTWYNPGMELINKQLGFWARKVLHILLNGTVAIAALFVPPQSLVPLTVAGFIAILLFELLRLKTEARRLVYDAMGPLFKKEEKVEYSGLFWAAIAALILSLFAQPLAYSYAFAILAVADSSAAIVGKAVHMKPFYRKKTAVGSFACFLAAASVTAVYIIVAQLPFPFLPSLILMGTLVAVLEMFSHPFDDNFLILVFSGFVMSLALNFH